MSLSRCVLFVALLPACSGEAPTSPSPTAAAQANDTPTTPAIAHAVAASKPVVPGDPRTARLATGLGTEAWDPKSAVGTWSATIQRASIGGLPVPGRENDTFPFEIDTQLRLDGKAALRAEGRSLLAEQGGVTTRLTWLDGSLYGQITRQDVAIEFVGVRR